MKEFSRTLLETLLQRELGEIRISIQSIRLPDSPNHRGIRLDVEINEYETKDGKTILKNIYDLEPNKRSTVDLPKHNRFNQAKIDSRNMKSGENPAIKSLLNFIQNSKINSVTDEVTKKFHDCVKRVKISPETREEYMKWESLLYYERMDGRLESKIEDILECLKELGDIPESLREKIQNEADLEQLSKWLKLAVKAESIEEFIEKCR